MLQHDVGGAGRRCTVESISTLGGLVQGRRLPRSSLMRLAQ